VNRRTLLRVAAGAVGGAGATAAGLSVATESAAQTGLALDVDGDSATIGADGSVSAVTLHCEIEWQYDVPDSTSPETVVIEVAAGTDGDVSVLTSAESAQLFAEADGSESFDVGLLAQDVLSAGALEPDGTSVTVEARLRVESTSDSVLAREAASDTAVLSVTRDGVEASEYGAVGGDGSLAISTE